MKKIIFFCLFVFASVASKAQLDSAKIAERKEENTPLKPVKLNLNKDGSNYIQFTGLVQAQVRWNNSNPGTTVNGTASPQTWDVGLRRVRFQILGQLSKRVFFYTQIGENNISYLAERKFGLFVLDALGEYALLKKHLSVGMGLSSWIGPLRYSAPGVGSFMGMDGPIYQQTTNDLNDQFVRRMGVYFKGKLGKLDYRVSITKPFIVNSTVNSPANISGGQAAVPVLAALGNGQSTFSTLNPNPQFNSYVSYQFFDQEDNRTPYNVGSYLGSKRVFNIGGGIQYQNQAMWHKELNTATGKIDTVSSQLLTAGIDVIYDAPINKEKGTAVHFYAAYMHSDYGQNYVRNLGVMNPADVTSKAPGALAGSGGSAFPMNGTGNTISAQAGYKFKNELLGSYGTLMPYVSCQATKYFNFSSEMFVYDIGVNWLLKGHNSKFSLDYQNRPFFTTASDGSINQFGRRGMVVLQYQVSF